MKMSGYVVHILALLAILVSCLADPGTTESSSKLKHARVERNVPPRFLMAATIPVRPTTHIPPTRATYTTSAYSTPVTVKGHAESSNQLKHARVARNVPPRFLMAATTTTRIPPPRPTKPTYPTPVTVKGTADSSNQLKHARVARNVPPRFLMAATTTTTRIPPPRPTKPTYPTPVTVKGPADSSTQLKHARVKRNVPPRFLMAATTPYTFTPPPRPTTPTPTPTPVTVKGAADSSNQLKRASNSKGKRVVRNVPPRFMMAAAVHTPKPTTSATYSPTYPTLTTKKLELKNPIHRGEKGRKVKEERSSQTNYKAARG